MEGIGSFAGGVATKVNSPVHLSKTVMNLVSNAAEAMPDGGKILISTENRYIDSPIRGYDNEKFPSSSVKLPAH